MTKRVLTFSAIQIVALLLSFFVLAFTLAGSHGRLYFSNAGGTVALIITTILSIPLIYLFTQRKKLQYKKLIYSIAILLFGAAMSALYIGIPVVTKQFLVDKKVMKNYPFLINNDIAISFTLQPEMFERVSVEATIDKTNTIEIKQLNLTVLDNKKQIVQPVFRPLAWDSSHSETIQMNNFFEINEYSKMNRFALSGQYSIANTASLIIQVTCNYAKSGQDYSLSKQFPVTVTNHLTREQLIEY